ncbi:hypothetical protein GEOBRER4_n0384 [Citrifermentans bremense]|uniref:Uncharacterized protein n=1 Tax=Citrifermentans bremense TaxID=60035 RepID=A0A6S6M0C3_9BACT|nr:hypothetical protein GEOBRER4_n0384 [Citrifermentans bremense]
MMGGSISPSTSPKSGKRPGNFPLPPEDPPAPSSILESVNPASKFALQRQNGEVAMVTVKGEKNLIPNREVEFRVYETWFLGVRQAERLF